MKGKTTKPKILREPPVGYNESATVICETLDGVRLDVKLEKDTFWLTHKQWPNCSIRNVVSLPNTCEIFSNTAN